MDATVILTTVTWEEIDQLMEQIWTYLLGRVDNAYLQRRAHNHIRLLSLHVTYYQYNYINGTTRYSYPYVLTVSPFAYAINDQRSYSSFQKVVDFLEQIFASDPNWDSLLISPEEQPKPAC